MDATLPARFVEFLSASNHVHRRRPWPEARIEGTETGTQRDLNGCHGPLDSGGGQTGPRSCLARNPCPEPGPTPLRTDLSRATHLCPAFGKAEFVA